MNPDISGKDDVVFADVWNPFHETVNKLYNFIRIHPNVITISELELESFFSRINDINNLLYNDRINNENTLTEYSFNKLYENLIYAQKELENSNNLCEKRILKI